MDGLELYQDVVLVEDHEKSGRKAGEKGTLIEFLTKQVVMVEFPTSINDDEIAVIEASFLRPSLLSDYIGLYDQVKLNRDFEGMSKWSVGTVIDLIEKDGQEFFTIEFTPAYLCRNILTIPADYLYSVDSPNLDD